jgi:hypothetical protein
MILPVPVVDVEQMGNVLTQTGQSLEVSLRGQNAVATLAAMELNIVICLVIIVIVKPRKRQKVFVRTIMNVLLVLVLGVNAMNR